MSVLVVTGTGTGVGKTVVTAAVATLARTVGRQVAVLKAVQTGVADGEPGDLADIVRLAGGVNTVELARYQDPLAPDTAARRAGLPPVRPDEIAAATGQLDEEHDLVLVEGAGGLLVRFDDTGATLADVAWALGVEVLIVARAGLGTLNETALTAEALRHRGIACKGVVVGEWPAEPDLAARCNLSDLPTAADAPLLGALPQDAGQLDRAQFVEAAAHGLAPELGGAFNLVDFLANNLAV